MLFCQDTERVHQTVMLGGESDESDSSDTEAEQIPQSGNDGQLSWYNPYRIYNYIKRAWSTPNLSVSQSNSLEVENVYDYVKQIGPAKLKLVTSDGSETFNAGAAIRYWTKNDDLKKKGPHNNPQFKKRSNKPEKGNLKTKQRFYDELTKKGICVVDEDGSTTIPRVIHVLVDIGFIPDAVTRSLQTTELMSTVIIVFEPNDSITNYADDICKSVITFCKKGHCKYKRNIVFDVREEEKFHDIKKRLSSTEEEEETRYNLEDRDQEMHILEINCTASLPNGNPSTVTYNNPISLDVIDAIKWKHICESRFCFKNLKFAIEKKTGCPEKTTVGAITIKRTEPLLSKSQGKKWRSEIISTIKNELAVLYYDKLSFKRDILTDCVEHLKLSEKLKSLDVSVWKINDESVLLCGLQTQMQEALTEAREIGGNILLRRSRRIYTEKMSKAKFEVFNRSNIGRSMKAEYNGIEFTYDSTNQQLVVEGPYAAKQFVENRIHEERFEHYELHISAQHKQLLLCETVQSYINKRFNEYDNNSAIDISKLCYKDSCTQMLKVTVYGETKQMASDAIRIIRSSIKKKTFSTQEPKMARVLESQRWSFKKMEIQNTYEGKLLIIQDDSKYMLNIICTDDIIEEVENKFEEEKERQVIKTGLDLEPDGFKYLNEWKRFELDTFAKARHVEISVKTPYVNMATCKPCFELIGFKEDVEYVTQFITRDLFQSIITKQFVVHDQPSLEFLEENDDTVFSELSKTKKCYIRMEQVTTKNDVLEWSSPCGRRFFVSKSKEQDADVIVRLKEHDVKRNAKTGLKRENKASGTHQDHTDKNSQFEDLIIPYCKGSLEKDMLNQNIDDLLQRVDARNVNVLAFPVPSNTIYDTQPDQIVRILLDRIQTYTSIKPKCSLERICFHELWRDVILNAVVGTLNDNFDREQTLLDHSCHEEIDSHIEGGRENYHNTRVIFVTGPKETVNKIRILHELQDMILRKQQEVSNLSRSSSVDSLSNSQNQSVYSGQSDFGSGDSFTLVFHRSGSDTDLRQENTKSNGLDKWNSAINLGTRETETKMANMEHRPTTPSYNTVREKETPKDSTFKKFTDFVKKPKRNKKRTQKAKSTSALHTVDEETGGYALRKIQDDRILVGPLEETLTKYSGSVGLIEIKLGHNQVTRGTGFHVGKGYIFSAFHVFKPYLDECEKLNRHDRAKQWAESVHIIFGHKSMEDKSQRKPYHFKMYPSQIAADIDLIVLALLDNEYSFPESFDLLRSEIPSSTRAISFLSYPKGRPLTLDPECPILKQNCLELEEARKHIQNKFSKHLTCFDELDDDKYFILHSQSRQGSSGSPGVLIGQFKKAMVCCIFLSIYPGFVFTELTEAERSAFPNKFMFERALKMSAVYQKLNDCNPQLCSEIFADDRDNVSMEF